MRSGFGKALGIAFCLAAVASVQSSAQTPQPKPAAKAVASPNDELIKLQVAGMDESILLATVAKTGPEKYDTSADALLKLKSAGVSQRVIAAILGVTPSNVQTPAPSAPPPPPSSVLPAQIPAGQPAGPQRDGNGSLIVSDADLPTLTENGETNLRFTIYISAPSRDGFLDTSKEIQDSIKDIKEKLSKEKNVILTVINDPKKADIVLTVVERGVGFEAYGHRTEFQQYYGGSTLEQTPMVASAFWVSTMMQVGRYKREFTGTWVFDQGKFTRLTWGAWTRCSDKITNNVASWTRANAVLLNRYREEARQASR